MARNDGRCGAKCAWRVNEHERGGGCPSAARSARRAVYVAYGRDMALIGSRRVLAGCR